MELGEIQMPRGLNRLEKFVIEIYATFKSD